MTAPCRPRFKSQLESCVEFACSPSGIRGFLTQSKNRDSGDLNIGWMNMSQARTTATRRKAGELSTCTVVYIKNISLIQKIISYFLNELYKVSVEKQVWGRSAASENITLEGWTCHQTLRFRSSIETYAQEERVLHQFTTWKLPS